MIRDLIAAAVEYFAGRGYSWNYARISASIAIAIYGFLNLLTATCLYYVVVGTFPGFLEDVGNWPYGLTLLTFAAFTWSVARTIQLEPAEEVERARLLRKRIWSVYFIGTLILFGVSIALVLVRMS
jgi:hypothetical protein